MRVLLVINIEMLTDSELAAIARANGDDTDMMVQWISGFIKLVAYRHR